MPRTTPIIKICPICNATFETTNSRKNNCSKKCGGLSSVKFHVPLSADSKCKLSDSLKQKYQSDPSYRIKVSESLKKYYKENPDKIMKGEKRSKLIAKSTKGKYNKNPKNILELSKRTVRKILSRIKIGCSKCKWNEDVCDIHHIQGRKIPNADAHSNLCYLCPNCHRLAHNGKIKQFISLEEMIGDTWKNYYYG